MTEKVIWEMQDYVQKKKSEDTLNKKILLFGAGVITGTIITGIFVVFYLLIH